MEDSLSNPGVFVFDHLKYSFPKHLNVFLDFAGAQLFDGFMPDVYVLIVCELKDFVHVFGFPALPDDVLLCGIHGLWELLLIDVSLLAHRVL